MKISILHYSDEVMLYHLDTDHLVAYSTKGGQQRALQVLDCNESILLMLKDKMIPEFKGWVLLDDTDEYSFPLSPEVKNTIRVCISGFIGHRHVAVPKEVYEEDSEDD